MRKGRLGKYMAAFLAVFTMPLLFSVLSFLQLMSAFEPDGVLKSSQYINGEETVVYRELKEIAEIYYEELYKTLENERQNVIREYTIEYQVPVTKEENSEEEKQEWRTVTIEPTVMRRMNYVPENIIIAYLLMKNGIKTDLAIIDGQMTTQFLQTISTVTINKVWMQEKDTYWVENKLLTISEIAELYFQTEKERNLFQVTCEAYGEYFGTAQTKVIDESGKEVYLGISVESGSDVPLYLQYDNAWANTAYGNGTIKINGCAPTCLAMVFSYFRGKEIYPDEIVRWSGNRYYVSGAGTSWSIFEPAGQHYGVPCSNIGKNQRQMINALQNGKLVIASMGAGTFTKGGHFIVLTGVTENGKITVNDPNDSTLKRHSEKEFAVSLIINECKNMWVFG